MKKTVIAVVVLLSLVLGGRSFAGDWELVKNVQRLEWVSTDYKGNREIDKKFLEVLGLTEKTRKEAEVYDEAKRIAGMQVLSQSKYMDSFLYYLFVRSLAFSKAGTREPDYWLGQLQTHEESPHLLAARLIRMRLLPRSSADVARDAQVIVDWIKLRKSTMKVRPPEYAGNVLLGYRPRVDFAEGEPPKLYTLGHYMRSVEALAGFMEEDTYVSLLGRIKAGRPEILEEMASLYRRQGKGKEASGVLLELAMLKAAAKEYTEAKTLLDSAVKLDPGNEQAQKTRDRIKLELAFQSLEPPQPVVQEASGIPQHLEAFNGQLTPADRVITEADLQGRGAAELRVMRNEIFARRGRTFSSPDLNEYFAKKPWYRPDPSYTDAVLTDIDRENVKIIEEYADKTR